MRIASTTGYSLDIVVSSSEDDAPSALSTIISPSQDDADPSEAFALISQLAKDVVAEYQACLNEGGLPTFASREEADPFFAHRETLEEFEMALGTWTASQAERLVDDEASTYHQLKGVLRLAG
ncbi:hypothetical protein JCM24511_00742 [Saitozyma sp. JCM 24511]|nr:hypothetical protein JCM24511_00742 [Saitozyma sp. JCM 24511]